MSKSTKLPKFWLISGIALVVVIIFVMLNPAGEVPLATEAPQITYTPSSTPSSTPSPTASSTTSPTPSPEETWDTLCRDEFGDESNPCGILVEPDYKGTDWQGTMVIGGGEFVVQGTRVQQDGAVWRVLKFQEIGKVLDFYLSSDIKFTSSNPDNTAGLAFYSSDDTNDYYLFEFKNNGQFRKRKYDNGTGENIDGKDWEISTAIQANQWNKVEVIARGGKFDIFVNDQFVTSFSAEAYKIGYVGLFFRFLEVNDSGYWEFDNIEARAPERGELTLVPGRPKDEITYCTLDPKHPAGIRVIARWPLQNKRGYYVAVQTSMGIDSFRASGWGFLPPDQKQFFADQDTSRICGYDAEWFVWSKPQSTDPDPGSTTFFEFLTGEGAAVQLTVGVDPDGLGISSLELDY